MPLSALLRSICRRPPRAAVRGAAGAVVALLVLSAGPALATTTATTSTASGIIGRNGTTLTLDGEPYTFTGVNAYELATDWGSNFGCGGDVFASGRGSGPGSRGGLAHVG